MKLNIPTFRDASVLVVGDVMLDRYWYGTTDRVSQEAPVPIVDVDSTEDRPGGAANVAMNLAALGIDVTLIGAVGDDETAQTLTDLLAAARVRSRFVVLQGWPTILKVRVVSRRQQVLRMDFEKTIPENVDARIEELLAAEVDAADVVVIEDYDKGTLSQPAASIDLAHRRGKRVVVDPKFKPFEAYRGADVIKPNAAEFAHAVGHWRSDDELVSKATALARLCDFGALVVTRGELGISVVERSGTAHHLPARPVDVFDETGAGDTVAAGLAAGLAAGCSVSESAMLANLAAGIVVTKSGTAAATSTELRRALVAQDVPRGVMTRDELARTVALARGAGERIVFTNGCFDILHAGHVAYLDEARALGDRLIVAINDDASVARLKGAGRPINPLAERLRVLAGLASVDWVVAFAEDTPEALLETLRPDVLVKGGDYALDAVVGADVVRRNGGEVRVLAHVPNVSTSAIVDQLRRSRDG